MNDGNFIQDPLLSKQPQINAQFRSSTPGDLRSPTGNQKSKLAYMPPIIQANIPAEENEKMIENNTNKFIDFNAQIKAIKNQTESNYPYTLTQVEDAMYISESTVVCLEYFYYQSNCNYYALQPQIETINSQTDKLVDQYGNPVTYALGTETYHMQNEQIHPMNVFDRKDIINFKQCDKSAFHELNSNQQEWFQRVDPGSYAQSPTTSNRVNNKTVKLDEAVKVEAVLGLYGVSKNGEMYRLAQNSVFFQRKFIPTQDNGAMKLTMSSNCDIFSLASFDPYDPKGEYFQIQAWYTKLKKFEVGDAVCRKMNQFYATVQNSFCELQEVKFVGNNQYLMLTYIEVPMSKDQIVRGRTLGTERDADKPKMNIQKVEILKKQNVRKAIKYAFFDAGTGDLKFEYGGVEKPITMKSTIGSSIRVYKLQALVKETIEKAFQPSLLLFYAGDFMDKRIIRNQKKNFRWAMSYLEIEIEQLFQISPNEQHQYIDQQIQKSINQSADLEQINYYPFDQSWVEQQRMDYHLNIKIQFNRKFNQFMIINSPSRESRMQPIIYVNGPHFQSQCNPKIIDGVDMRFRIPFQLNYPMETIIKHQRNSFIKDHLVFHQITNGELNTISIIYSLKSTQLESNYVKIPITSYISEPDVWIHVYQYSQNEQQHIYQTVNVTKGDQYALLQTRYPLIKGSKRISDYIIYNRRSNQYCQQITQSPIVAYNLGDSKICIQNTENITGQTTSYILKMQEDEKFVSFVSFNSFKDIGFFPYTLKIECCSYFMYITTRKDTGLLSNPDETALNKFNLFIVDSFNRILQSCLFRSNTCYDNELLSQEDFIIKSCIQSTIKMNGDQWYKSYLWTQFPNNLVRSAMLRVIGTDKNGEQYYEIDSDIEIEEELRHEAELDEEEELNLMDISTYEHVQMYQDKRGFIYYILQKNGEFQIMEGNPKEPYINKHYSIFSIKAQKCLAFSVIDEYFFFMNEDVMVFLLSRNESTRRLHIHKELSMKQVLKIDFKVLPFDDPLINQNYVIQGNKIFYLSDNSEPMYTEGILESEDLISEDRLTHNWKYYRGPMLFFGSNRYYNIYCQDKFTAKMHLFRKPDCTSKLMINDHQNIVRMSTFILDGKILIKISGRFLVFNSRGVFLDEVEFDNGTSRETGQDFYEGKEQKYIKLSKTLKNTVPKYLTKGNAPDEFEFVDFQGQPYKIERDEHRDPITSANRMELLQMSFDNNIWLFYNHCNEKIYVYELKEVNYQQKHQNQIIERRGYRFVMKFEVKLRECEQYKNMQTKEIDLLDYYRTNRHQIKIDKQAHVKFCYVENIQHSYGGVEDIEITNHNTPCKYFLTALTFQPGEGKASVMYSSQFEFEFPLEAQIKLNEINQKKKHDLLRKIDIVRVKQQNLPQKLFNYAEYETLINDYIELCDKALDNVFAKIYNDNLIIIYCGRYLYYGYLISNHNKPSLLKPDSVDLMLANDSLEKINVTFGKMIEIIKVVETCTPYVLQIQMKDHERNFYSIVTWDFSQNIEVVQYQIPIDEQHDIGYHLVRGLNAKYNYFINKNQLVDLEFALPVRQTNIDQKISKTTTSYVRQCQNINNFYNQRKLFIDNSRFLGIEQANTLYYPVSHLDLLLWQNIIQLGQDASTIDQCVKLQNFNLTIDGSTMFHYFSTDPEIIEVIHAKYTNQKELQFATEMDYYLPIQIVMPDNEGKTALYRAVLSQSPTCFECMVNMLQGFNDFTISKMIIKSICSILEHDEETVINFFEYNIFCPPQMQVQQFVPWKEGMEAFVFASHTAIISQELLLEKLSEQGIEPELPATVEENIDPSSSKVEEKDITKREKIDVKTMYKYKNALHDWSIGHEVEEAPEPEDSLQKVCVEALDMDWIFYKDNASQVLSMLGDANAKVLTKKSIKIFVNLLWTYYQPTIVKMIFFPYVIYLIFLSQLTGAVASQHIDCLYSDRTDEDIYLSCIFVQAKAYFLTTCCMTAMAFFASLELGQMMESGLGYFLDPWNFIDSTSLSLNCTYLVLFTVNCAFNTEIIPIEFLTTCGSFCCFFMWIKVFYWMRLFSTLAKYVKLIQQTLVDSTPFMIMVFIIVAAFANYVYVANTNMIHERKSTVYYAPYLGYPIFDVVMSTYNLGMLGDFDTELFRKGYDRAEITIMFILATYIIMVVFMNMLIAIMGDTFGTCLETQEEDGLMEQVSLMGDNLWLLDLADVFKGQRYIIVITPGRENESPLNEALDAVKNGQKQLTKKLNKMQQRIMKKVHNVDLNTRNMLKTQQSGITKIQKKIKSMFDLKAEQEMVADQSFILKQEENERKKRNLINSLMDKNFGQGHDALLQLQSIAVQWIQIVDEDKNGRLSFNEFVDFCHSLQNINYDEDQMKQVFEMFNISKTGELSIQEFVSALHELIMGDKYLEDEGLGHEDEYNSEEFDQSFVYQ